HAGLDAVAVMPGPNLVYLADLHAHLSERPTLAIIPTRGTPALILPAFEAGKAKASPLNAELFTYDDSNGPSAAFSEALSSLNLSGRRLGVEPRRIRFLELDLLARSSHAPRPEACDAVFARLRMCKDAAELALMRKAIAIAETALQKTLPSVRPG